MGIRKTKEKQHRRLTVKKGDTVVVISGREADRGTVGKITRVIPKKDQVVVEGVNIRTFHQKPTMQGQKGSLVKKEAPVHRSRVMVYDQADKKGSRVGHEVREDGTKHRVSRRSGDSLDA